ncbi:MAG: sigma-70 family RNA polymerase sigma factor [Isosphaeraceae bacterium]
MRQSTPLYGQGSHNMADDADRGATDAEPPTHNIGPSDHSLLRQFRHGDPNAARLLYQRYIGRLRALARAWQPVDLNGRFDDEDIVQSVFGSFFRRAQDGAYDVPAGEEIWNLFLVITLNKIRAKGQYHRAAKRDVRQTAGEHEIARLPEVLDTDSQAVTVLRLSIEEVLESLSERHRTVLRLRMADHEVAEIAQMIGRSKRSVERILQEGRNLLQERLEVR